MKLAFRFCIVAALFSALGAAQTAETPTAFSDQTLSDLKRVQKAVLSDDYAYQQLAHLTDNIGPRLSGSPQYDHATEYVAAEMRRLGLEVTLEKVMVPHWVRGEETGALVEFPGMARGTTQKIVLTALGDSTATPGEGITSDVVVVDNIEELKALGREKVAGKIVLVNLKFDRHLAEMGFGLEAYGQAVRNRSECPNEASRLGAAAALIRSVGNQELRIPHTGETHFEKDVKPIPAAALTAEDADLMERLAKQGRIRMHLVLTPHKEADHETVQVIGDLKGSEHPEQIVIVSGHLDSWDLGTGAIDDGAGVAAALETAKVLKQLNLKPKRTIRVIAWANEENGLMGGKTYGRDHANEMANHYAAIEADLGAGHPAGFFFAGDASLATLLAPLARILESSGSGVIRDSAEAGADIIPVTVAGVPGFAPIFDSRYYFNWHHTPADTLDKVDPKELNDVAAVCAVLSYGLANMDATIPHHPQPLPDWLK